MSKKKYFLWGLVLLIRYSLFYVGAWQLDIVCSPLIWEVRNRRFFFWSLDWSLSYWTVYPLFFNIMTLGAFLPEIVFVGRWLLLTALNARADTDYNE